MGRITDLMLFRSRRDRGAEELSDAAMVHVLRAAGEELVELRALIQRIAIVSRDPEDEPPGGAERKLRAIAALLKHYRF